MVVGVNAKVLPLPQLVVVTVPEELIVRQEPAEPPREETVRLVVDAVSE